MPVVTGTARQPLRTTPDPTRAIKILHVVTTYLEGNQLLVHNVKSATMVHNAPPPPLRPRDPPMNPVNMATYLEVQKAATAGGVTLPPNLIRQLTRTLVIARITALSTQALAYFLQAVLNAAIGFQALHLTHAQDMLQAAATTVQRAWTIHGHQPTSLPATVRAASPPYYGDNTAHLVNNTYTAHTAAHLHCLMQNHEPELREVFTLTLREAEYIRNTCPRIHTSTAGPPHQGGDPCMEPPTTPATPPPAGHPNEPSVQGNRPSGGPTHRCGGRANGKHHHSGPGGHHPPASTGHPKPDVSPPTSGDTARPVPTTPEWPNKSLLENHMRSAATQTGHLQPTDEEIREAYNLFCNTHKRPLPRSPPRGNPAHDRLPEQVEYAPGARVPAVLLLAPNRLEATLRPGRAGGNLWMLPPPTACPFCQPPLSQDKLTGTPTTCWRCGPQVLATLWPLHQLLLRYHPMPTAHANPEQHRWLHTHFKRAGERDTATVAWGPSAKAEWRFHRGTQDNQHLAITFPVLAKHRSPVKHRCSQVEDLQTVEWTILHPQTAYLLQYVYGYLTKGHEENNDFVRMNLAAAGIIRQGVGVYATWRLRRDANKPWATTERGAHIHAYQPTMPCGLPHPDDHNTVIFADASGTTSLTPAAGGAALELKVDTTGRLHQHHLTGATIFGASSHGELKTPAIVMEAVNDIHQ